MIYSCDLRKGFVYMSVFAKTEAGFYRAIEPVIIVSVSQTTELHRAISETIARGNPTIPTPHYGEISATIPIILKHAGVKTWNAFERGSRCWMIREKDGTYQIVGQREGEYGGWVDDPEQTTMFPSGTSVDLVIDRLIEILQAAAKERSR